MWSYQNTSLQCSPTTINHYNVVLLQYIITMLSYYNTSLQYVWSYYSTSLQYGLTTIHHYNMVLYNTSLKYGLTTIHHYNMVLIQYIITICSYYNLNFSVENLFCKELVADPKLYHFCQCSISTVLELINVLN